MFADWAAELLHSAPDPDTTARHVSSMVDVSIRLRDFPYSLKQNLFDSAVN